MATSTRSRKKTKRSAARSLHTERFPGESPEYRQARNRLLRAEISLRKQIEDVAAMRRELPPGGIIPEDYVFEEAADKAGRSRRVRFSELFAPGKDTLVIYSFMYGPKMEEPCPMCSSFLDSLEGTAPHLMQRVNFAVAARSSLPRILAFARQRGWRKFRLLSSAGNNYNRDYHGEGPDGSQWPIMNVFVKRRGKIHHFWATELLFSPAESGQDRRHVDMMWPLWNVLDVTPSGRGKTWYPQLRY